MCFSIEINPYDLIFSAIEYAINSTESNEAGRRCDNLSAQREELNNQQNRAETEMIGVQESIQNVENQIRKLESRFKVYRDETDRVTAEKTELLERKKAIELSIKDLQDDMSVERTGRKGAEETLARVRGEISAKQRELEDLMPEFNQLVEEEKRLQTDISINEQKCQELNAKIGRQNMYTTVQGRDEYLNREILTNKNQIRDTDKQIAEIGESINEDGKEKQELEHDATVNFEPFQSLFCLGL